MNRRFNSKIMVVLLALMQTSMSFAFSDLDEVGDKNPIVKPTKYATPVEDQSIKETIVNETNSTPKGFWGKRSRTKLVLGSSLLAVGAGAAYYGFSPKVENIGKNRTVTGSCGFGCTYTTTEHYYTDESKPKFSEVGSAGVGVGIVGLVFLTSYLMNGPSSRVSKVSKMDFLPQINVVNGTLGASLTAQYRFIGLENAASGN